MLWLYAIGAGIAGALVWAVARPSVASASPATVAPGAKTNPGTGSMKLVPTVIPADPFANAVTVHTPDGVAWLVAPDYIGPVGIGEAADIAKQAGGELPTAALVDAIWRQADLKIVPPVRAQNIVSAAVFADQQARIKNLVADRPFTLLGGTYKDVIQMGGHPQLYGWHVDVEHGVSGPAGVPLHSPFTPGPGKIIQGPSGAAHSLSFKDYSQGLRLVKKA
jgi:hypothetical protein